MDFNPPTTADLAFSAGMTAQVEARHLRDEITELRRKLNEVIDVVQAMQGAFRLLNR